MTSATDTLPDMIEVNGERFFKTCYTNVSLANHQWGEGVEMREYWRDGRDDCRLQVRTENDYVLD